MNYFLQACMQAAAMVGPLKQASLSLSTTFALCIHLSLLFLSGASALMLGLGCCYLLSEWGMWRHAYRTVAACGWLVQYVFVCVDDPNFANKEQQRPVNPTHHMPFCSLLLPTTIDADGDQIDAQMRRRRIHLFFLPELGLLGVPIFA